MDINSSVCSNTTANISELLDKFIKFWNDKNIDCFCDLFVEKAEFTDVIGQVAIGIDEIKKQHEFPFSKTMKKAVLTFNEIRARALSPELVIVTASWETKHNLTPDGLDAPDRNGIIQIIAKKIEDNYKIALVHNTDITQVYKDMPTAKGKFHTV